VAARVSSPRSYSDPPLYTERYGISTYWEQPPWTHRHHVGGGTEWPLVQPRHRCRCGGPKADYEPQQCHQRATQEDILCDECRRWCVAIDDAGEYHLLADLYPLPSEPCRT
jgi:hypothetical protein